MSGIVPGLGIKKLNTPTVLDVCPHEAQMGGAWVGDEILTK